MEPRPTWWPQVEVELDGLVANFTAKIETRLRDFQRRPFHYLARKNPFLYRLRAMDHPEQLATAVLEAFLSSSEETMFGGMIEDCAIAVCRHAKGGQKSSAENIDLEYRSDHDQRSVTIVQIKSGPNWGNSSQRRKMVQDFQIAVRRLRQGMSIRDVRCIEGTCYGESAERDKGSHVLLVGPRFWEEITDWSGTSDAIMSVMGRHAQNGLAEARAAAREALIEALRAAGLASADAIDWPRLHAYLSAGQWRR